MSIGDFYVGNIYVVAKKCEPAGLSFENRYREWHGFALILNGGGELFTNTEVPIALTRGEVVLFTRGCRYRMELTPGTQYITSAFDLCVADRAFDPIGIRVMVADSETERLLNYAADCFERRREGDSVRCRIAITEAYSRIFENMSECGDGNSDAERAAKLIRESFRGELSVRDVARACSISESYLRACFKRRFGVSVTEYRDEIRLREAENMLRSGLFTVKEVAEALGYCDVFYFSRRFKLGTGESPAAYRDRFTGQKNRFAQR